MMTADPLRALAPNIPPSVSAALDELFREECFIAHKAVAEFLKMSDTWLRRLGNDAHIEFFPKGKSHRVYAREHIEAFLRGRDQCQSTGRKTPRVNTSRRSITMTFKSKSLGEKRNVFTAQRARERAARQKQSKPPSASGPRLVS